MSSEIRMGCGIIAGTRACDPLSCGPQSRLTSQKRIRDPKSRLIVQCIIPTVYTEGMLHKPNISKLLPCEATLPYLQFQIHISPACYCHVLCHKIAPRPPTSTFMRGTSTTIIHNMPPSDRMSRRVGVDLATDEVRG
jgi:hypothetical protein